MSLLSAEWLIGRTQTREYNLRSPRRQYSGRAEQPNRLESIRKTVFAVET